MIFGWFFIFVERDVVEFCWVNVVMSVCCCVILDCVWYVFSYLSLGILDFKVNKLS